MPSALYGKRSLNRATRHQEVGVSMIRTIIVQPNATQPNAKHTQAQFDVVIRVLRPNHPKVPQTLLNAGDDIPAFCGFPPKHWRQIWPTNP
jgi:transposase-like protein